LRSQWQFPAQPRWSSNEKNGSFRQTGSCQWTRIDSSSRLSPCIDHSTRILRPTRAYGITVQRISRIYVARMQILTSRCVPDGFSTIYFFFPTMTMCTVPRAWNFWLCYKDQARCKISVGLKKVLHDRDQWGTSDPLCQCVFQNAWVIGILVTYKKKIELWE